MTDRARLLVIGYGNDLRSDDGAGRIAADGVEALDLPDVEVHSVSQLTPELAPIVADRRYVVFVDANVDAHNVVERRVTAAPGAGVMTHHGDPGVLLALAALVGEPPVEAWTISIPAVQLGLGFELSEITARSVERTVDRIVEIAQRITDQSGR